MSFEVRASRPGHGLGVFAARDLPAGHLLVQETCLTHALPLKLFSFVCRSCLHCDLGNPAPLPEGCGSSSCGARFCSLGCQAAHESAGAKCRSLARFQGARGFFAAEKVPLEDVALVQAVAGCLQCREAVLELAPMPDSACRPLSDNLLGLASAIFDVNDAETDLEELRALANIEQNNAFGLHVALPQGGALPVGRALYPTGSRFNHHCDSNVARVRRGLQMAFITRRAVSAGSELCISYVRPGLAEKHDALRQAYGFECDCDAEDTILPSCESCGGEMLLDKCVLHGQF